MNLIRLVADMMHLASIIILLMKIKKSRSCSGISLKTQILYAIVFCTRYLDLFTIFVSVYNSCMKGFFIVSSLYTVYLMKIRFKQSYDVKLDTFKIEYLLLGSFILGLAFSAEYTVVEVLWSFSLWLESVAILPQLFMLQKTGEAETITTHYLFALGAYRGLYTLNWIYRHFYERHSTDWIVWAAGILQTALYSDFFYIYYNKVVKGTKFELPKMV